MGFEEFCQKQLAVGCDNQHHGFNFGGDNGFDNGKCRGQWSAG